MSQEDRAQEVELAAWEANQRRPEPVRAAPGDADYGPAECRTCGDDMPAPRRAHGFGQCVACAEAGERNMRLVYGRF